MAEQKCTGCGRMAKLNDERITCVKAPGKTEIRTIRSLIFMGAISMAMFIIWFVDASHVGQPAIFCLLTFALLFKLVKMVHEWYHYWSPSVPQRPHSTRQWKVDVLTTACPGEPKEMIARTVRAMVAITYPHTNYLCDEGNDPELKALCEELGVIHVTRIEKKDAKAGNINNALRQATGEICVVLDPDHEPIPQFLDRVLPYFEDKNIGFVQCVQAYGNQDESFVARGAAEQTYHFYGPMMMCMNTYGTVQAIGANCTFRRSALDSIGGHAPGLSEDMHTAMQLHAKGWKSVYVPEILTRGLVPATLSSYYKQQLKWSRGTFELLFRTFPALKNQFTWRQKIHYFTIPLYFLFGLINLIDILVPLFALSLAEVPWEVNLQKFAAYFLPLCAISMMVRLYAQRWLLEDHERGFHLAGGILRLATWWIFLVGFVYTIFKIRVPYIPTPKEDEHQNYLRLSVPNFVTLVIALLIVMYGLSIDWTPYSIAMASYSFMTISMLAFTVIMSQQKLLAQVSTVSKTIPALNLVTALAGAVTSKSQQAVYQLMRNGPVVLIIGVSMFFVSYSVIDEENGNVGAQKELGGFYYGTEGKNHEASATPFNVEPIHVTWNNPKEELNARLLTQVQQKGGLPYLQWLAQEESWENVCTGIKKGEYDTYLRDCALAFRSYKDPVFVTFPQGGQDCSSQAFAEAWQYLYTYFNNLGISNLTWVWCPASTRDHAYYPGEKFVDWMGVECLNYADSPAKNDWYSFSTLYQPYRKAYGPYQKPVLITAFGAAAGHFQKEWITQAGGDITAEFTEVKGVILYQGEKHTTYKTSSGELAKYITRFHCDPKTPSDFATLLEDKGENIRKFSKTAFVAGQGQTKYVSPFVRGSAGQFTLQVRQQPYYIRGVAYNTAHDWRDGNMPLTRRQVEKDFDLIKAMGANTIRRYGTGIYDRNVLNIAGEKGLNVLFGFWFDPKIDFFSDKEKVEDYMQEVEEKVLEYKDHHSVIAWSLGNESWGLLKHRYAKPYLVHVRRAYIQMIEQLARRIHELDPTRPVFSCIEHEEYQLGGELVAFRDEAPSLDVIGINSYYREQISNLNHVAWQFDSLRPYLVSEFGPEGYWDPKYNRTSAGSLAEQSDAEKAMWYRSQWSNYVAAFKGYNVGGFAYCWHDRMEGTFTWFGLTDFEGRPKPAYYALKSEWTKKSEPVIPTYKIVSSAQLLPGNTYTIYAAGSDLRDKNIEWRLLKDEYLDEINCIEELGDNGQIEITIPEEPSSYRLYMHVSNKEGSWVTTASLPVKVRAVKN